MSKRPRKIIAGLGVLLILLVASGGVIAAYPLLYAERIYPGVYVRGVELGGLTVEEATALLKSRFPTPSPPVLVLEGPERSWQFDQAATGRRYDWAATAQAAYQEPRQGPWHIRTLSAWRVRLDGLPVELRIDPADPGHVTRLLKSVAAEIRMPPADAELRIDGDGVTCVTGEDGRALDLEATSDGVMKALAKGAAEVELTTVSLPPDLPEPEPGCAEARKLLSRPFTLVVDDPLTGYKADFEVPPQQIAGWLRSKAADESIEIVIEEAQVRSWLQEVAPQVGPERSLDVDETLERAMTALREGKHQARSAIRHPETTYVVEPGDTLFDIAYNHGFPQWRLEEANPDVEPDQLLIGMELTIPSIDVLFPEPLVPGKRIEIDLPEQQLRAYEEDEVVYEFTVSSGMTKTPTIAGQFQVLFKEPDAYAQRWSLEMPYFMAIYHERPGFANGIHELPIRADGQRLWASILGWPASYGCIILDVGDAEKLYNWAPVGTLVRIEGVAPGTPLYVPTYDEQASGQ